MTKIDPIIAVEDVDKSAKWYEKIFGFKNSSPEGHAFAVLKSETNEIVLCLHQWEMDEHPTMPEPSILNVCLHSCAPCGNFIHL